MFIGICTVIFGILFFIIILYMIMDALLLIEYILSFKHRKTYRKTFALKTAVLVIAFIFVILIFLSLINVINFYKIFRERDYDILIVKDSVSNKSYTVVFAILVLIFNHISYLAASIIGNWIDKKKQTA